MTPRGEQIKSKIHLKNEDLCPTGHFLQPITSPESSSRPINQAAPPTKHAVKHDFHPANKSRHMGFNQSCHSSFKTIYTPRPPAGDGSVAQPCTADQLRVRCTSFAAAAAASAAELPLMVHLCNLFNLTSNPSGTSSSSK